MFVDIRHPTTKEIEEIRKFDKEGMSYFFNDPYTFSSGLVFDDSGTKILGAGIIRVLEELRTTVDDSLSNYQKAEVIKRLLEASFKQRKTRELLAFISKGGKHYIELLSNHYGFRVIDDGVVPMKLEL